MRPSFSRAAALALTALLGCAHAPKSAPTPAPAPAPASAGSQAPPAPSAEAEPQAQATPPRLDPSEEITPEELASIPDPVPGGSSPEPIEQTPLAPGAQAPVPAPAPTAPAAPAPSTPAPAPGAAGSTASAGVWRVQIFASPDRAQADRVGREASERFGAPYVLFQDGTLVKVRLGSFEREEDAQALKERAVKSGYSGAFRVLDRGGS